LESARKQSTQSFAHDALFDTATRAASCQFAVYHDRRQAADTMLRGTACNGLLVHVMHDHLVFRACQLTDGFMSLQVLQPALKISILCFIRIFSLCIPLDDTRRRWNASRAGRC